MHTETRHIHPEIRVQQRERCPLCGEKGVPLYENIADRMYGTPGKWSLLRCTSDELVWINPCPVSADIPKLYETYYTHQPATASSPDATPSRRAISGREGLREKAVQLLLGLGVLDLLSAPSFWAASWLPPGQPGTFLDIGCGNGAFLQTMKQLGWKVAGVEPDVEAARIARREFDLDVIPGTLEDAHFAGDSFEVARMNHVVEHLLDPLPTLRECYRTLKPGGRLLIYTPNLTSLGHRHGFQSAWLHLDPPRHLFLFTADSLKSVVERAGFRVARVSTSARGARHTWMNSWYIRQNGRWQPNWRQEIPAYVGLQGQMVQLLQTFLCRFVNVGEDLQMIAVKDGK